MKKKNICKKNKLYLGGKKQKGGSFLLGLGASLALPLVSKLLLGKGKRKKRGKKGEEKEEEDGKKEKEYCSSKKRLSS